MEAKNNTVLVMAAGTGGHIFPALSIVQQLSRRGISAQWLGTQNGMEHELLADQKIKIHTVSAKGLKGKGIARKLLAPLMIMQALVQSMKVIRQVKPICVLGMGGFVSGPGGLAAKLMGKTLYIHEQNAVAGSTNRILARLADRVFEAFPNTFAGNKKVTYTGNPLREEILGVRKDSNNVTQGDSPLRVLVLGGSQGAAAINNIMPELLLAWGDGNLPELLHQTGARTLDATRQLYVERGLEFSDRLRVQAFIDDMADAYNWADIVICRSGASTVSELAAVGLPAILVPYPHHSDQQQTFNAHWLSDNHAAELVQQQDLTPGSLLSKLQALDSDREALRRMSEQASSIGIRDASERIADACVELAYV